jgi:hypothetical protein
MTTSRPDIAFRPCGVEARRRWLHEIAPEEARQAERVRVQINEARLRRLGQQTGPTPAGLLVPASSIPFSRTSRRRFQCRHLIVFRSHAPLSWLSNPTTVPPSKSADFLRSSMSLVKMTKAYPLHFIIAEEEAFLVSCPIPTFLKVMTCIPI